MVVLICLLLWDAPVGVVRTPIGAQPVAPAADSYAAARARAIRENKPLIVWVGGNFCDRCVNDSANEFVHHFAADGWDGNKGPATVVAVPHQGGLYYAGVVTRWTVGSHDWGHVPSARRIAAEWRFRAAAGNTAQLPLLNFGDGNWGWPSDRRSLPAHRDGTRPLATPPPAASC